MMNKIQSNILFSVAIVLVVIVSGLFLINKVPTIEKPTLGAVDTTGWKTSADMKTGVTFKYPADIGTKYISLVDWPPQVQVIEGGFVCSDAGEEAARAGKTELRTINGHEYCVTVVSEGAAGSMYNQYAYAAKVNNKTLYFTFTLRFVQCDNYDEPKKSECKIERASFDADILADDVISTTVLE